MESNDRRQRQSNSQGYPGQSGLLQQSPQYPQTSAPDRFRQPTIQQSPTSAPSQRRGAGQQYGTYPYGDSQQFVGSSIQAGALHYPPDYTQDSGRAAQQQQYGQYGPGLVYNVPPQQQATSPTSPFGPVQSYQTHQRQSSTIEVLPNQFVPPQYYAPSAGDTVPTSAAQSAIGSQNVPSQYGSLSYTQQSPVGQTRDSLGSAYGNSLADSSAVATSSSQYGAPTYGLQSASELDAAYGQYQTELRRTNESVRDGRLSDAGSSLMNISDWLLGNAETLGLFRDDEAIHDDRLSLWEDFNNCWLATLQKQKDMTKEVLRTGQSIQQPQSLIDLEVLKSMGNELVRQCDSMEKHGLVDYQMGVWEEAIMDLLVQCLDLQETNGGGFNAAHPGPSNQRRR